MMSPSAHFAHQVPWHCFAPMLIQIGYGYLVAGDLTKCSDIFMYKRTLS